MCFMLFFGETGWARDEIGTGDRSICCNYKFCFFHIKVYTKLLRGLTSISQRISRQLFVEVPYINYRYLETKMVLEKISDMPVTGKPIQPDRLRQVPRLVLKNSDRFYLWGRHWRVDGSGEFNISRKDSAGRWRDNFLADWRISVLHPTYFWSISEFLFFFIILF
jgi:hypothetical protein